VCIKTRSKEVVTFFAVSFTCPPFFDWPRNKKAAGLTAAASAFAIPAPMQRIFHFNFALVVV
jgi:hypothetical protein